MKSNNSSCNTFSRYVNSRHNTKLLSIYIVYFVLWIAGCGPQVSEKYIPPAELNLRYVGMAYTQYLTDKGQSPQSLDELKSVLAEFGDPEQLGISPRDGKPYVIVPAGKVLAYEQVGVAGKRFVVDRRFTAWEVDDAEFRKLGLGKK
jgi:hypothetical protein